eukprot:PhF_6_TR2598/c0_g1_i1/m.4389
MHSFLSSSVRGSVSTIKPYAMCLQPKPPVLPKSQSVGSVYPCGLLQSVRNPYAIPEVMRTYLLQNVISWSTTHKFTEHGRALSQHGLYQKTVSDLIVSIYTIEAISALDPSEEEFLNVVSNAVVVEKAWEAVGRVLQHGYGRKGFTESEINLFKDLTRMRVANKKAFSCLGDESKKVVAGEKPLSALPHVHSTLLMDSEKLVDAIVELSKNKSTLDSYTLGKSAADAWSAAVTLWRATDSLDQEIDSANHEWLLATRQVTQTCLELKETIQCKGITSKMLSSKLDEVSILEQNPLNLKPAKLAPALRRTPKPEENTAEK